MNYNERNAHRRDESILFDEASHTYMVNGKIFNTVTTLVENCFEKFDADYWAKRKATPTCPAEKLKAMWAEKGKIARDLGTQLHDRIERHYLGAEHDPKALEDPAYCHFMTFANTRHLTPYRSEWRIYIEEFALAGTLDFLAITPDGKFEIWDWKRSNKVVDNFGKPIISNNYHKSGFDPIGHLPDTTFYHYALQVSIYRYILAEKYGIDTIAGHLGVFHPDYQQPWVVDVPYLHDEVVALLSHSL